jgi:hypothetical protein
MPQDALASSSSENISPVHNPHYNMLHHLLSCSAISIRTSYQVQHLSIFMWTLCRLAQCVHNITFYMQIEILSTQIVSCHCLIKDWVRLSGKYHSLGWFHNCDMCYTSSARLCMNLLTLGQQCLFAVWHHAIKNRYCKYWCTYIFFKFKSYTILYNIFTLIICKLSIYFYCIQEEKEGLPHIAALLIQSYCFAANFMVVWDISSSLGHVVLKLFYIYACNRKIKYNTQKVIGAWEVKDQLYDVTGNCE